MIKTKIAVAQGDGIGPEIMQAVISIFKAAEVPLDYTYVDMGKSIFDKGYSTGMTEEAQETIERLGILFKGPMETPKGKGVKSINVTARKLWNTYANVRKFRSFRGVETVFSQAGIQVDLTVLRENIEDTYGGIEFMQTQDVAVAYRLVTRPGIEQFLRFAFEFAKREGLTQITCGHKANIMKITDGLFMNTFYNMAVEYPGIQANDLIVDDLSMKLVRNPDRFQLIVLTNLQGDIISDLCAGLVGGLGFAPSANVGDNISIFEAVHGTAPDIAGKKLANPSSLLMSGIMMLRHLGLISYADKIENAMLATLEAGAHTGDFGDKSTPALGTDDFTGAIIKNLGKKPAETTPINTGTSDFEFKRPELRHKNRIMYSPEWEDEKLTGVDVFLKSKLDPELLAEEVKPLISAKLQLVVISNRGTQVWPSGSEYTDCVAHYCLRFEILNDAEPITQKELLDFCGVLSEKFNLSDIEFLKRWGELRGYTLAQGQR